MSHLIVYCARPIMGCKFDEIEEYYQRIGDRLRAAGIQVFIPAWRVGFSAGDREQRPDGSWASPEIDRVIKEGDKWLVQHSNVLFVNLEGVTRASIGSVMELAWADDADVRSIVVMGESSVHRHPFVCNCAYQIFCTEEEALSFLEDVMRGSN